MQEKIQIALCTDEYNLAGLFITINSIIQNCSAPQRLEFFVLINNDVMKNLMEMYSVKLFKNIPITFQTINEENKNKIGGYNEFCEANVHCKNLMNFARFFLTDIFTDLKKFIYIDTDYLIVDDIVQLWNFTNDTDTFFAVPSEYTNQNAYSLTDFGKNSLQLSSRRPFNAGIYIVNGDKWRANMYTQVFTTMVNDKQINKCFRFGTQPLLNYVFQESYTYLPTRWNRIAYDKVDEFGGQRIIDLMNGLTKDQLVKEGISAIHFAGMPKPWLFTNQLAGGCWPSPNDLYKQFLPYPSVLQLNRKLLDKHTSLMTKFIGTLNEFFSINVIFIQSEKPFTEIEEYLDKQCGSTDDKYRSSQFYALLSGKLIYNRTVFPNNVALQISEQIPEKTDGVYVITLNDSGLYFNRKNLFEEVVYLGFAGESHLSFLKLMYAYVCLEYLL